MMKRQNGEDDDDDKDDDDYNGTHRATALTKGSVRHAEHIGKGKAEEMFLFMSSNIFHHNSHHFNISHHKSHKYHH